MKSAPEGPISSPQHTLAWGHILSGPAIAAVSEHLPCASLGLALGKDKCQGCNPPRAWKRRNDINATDAVYGEILTASPGARPGAGGDFFVGKKGSY